MDVDGGRDRGCLTQPVEQDPLHFLVLNKKEVRVKLNEHVVIKSKMMYRDKILMHRWNMENIV
jgi:hypothetical protein